VRKIVLEGKHFFVDSSFKVIIYGRPASVKDKAKYAKMFASQVYVETKRGVSQDTIDKYKCIGAGIIYNNKILLEPDPVCYRDDNIFNMAVVAYNNPPCELRQRLDEYIKEHPDATPSEMYHNVTHHYSSYSSFYGGIYDSPWQ